MVMASQLHLEAHPDHVVVSLDMENAYNEIVRARVLEALWSKPDLRPLFMFFYKEMAPESYVGLGSGTHMQTAPFRSAEGEHTARGTQERAQLLHWGTLRKYSDK